MSLYRHYAPVIDWTEKKTKSIKYKKAEVKPVARSAEEAIKIIEE